jgi:hypothetical protein
MALNSSSARNRKVPAKGCAASHFFPNLRRFRSIREQEPTVGTPDGSRSCHGKHRCGERRRRYPVGTAAVPPEIAAANRELIHAAKALNASEMFGDENELTFQMDRRARHMVLRVVNRKTGEVVSQVPPEVVLRLAADLDGRVHESGDASR